MQNPGCEADERQIVANNAALINSSDVLNMVEGRQRVEMGLVLALKVFSQKFPK